jgi:exopolysaccharide biosynthesis polyprenyl glycosylphosphotransferase
MTPYRRKLVVGLFEVIDLGLITFAFFAAASAPLLFSQGLAAFTAFFQVRVKVVNVFLYLFILLLWHIILSSFQLYESKRLTGRRGEIAETLKAVALCVLVICVAGPAFRIKMVSPVTILLFWALASFIAVLSRLALKSFLSYLRRHEKNLRWVLIVGANRQASEIAQRFEVHPELGYRVLGFADVEWEGTAAIRSRGGKIVCALDEIVAFLRVNVVDEVILTLPMRSMHSTASEIARLCEEQGITVRMPLRIFDLRTVRASVEEHDEESLVALYSSVAEGGQHLAKRIFDIVVSSALLLVLSPLLLAIALLIKKNSHGPVFFFQQRVGRNKRLFRMCKFRSMVIDAEAKLSALESKNEVSGPVFKIKDDPRITPIGKFIRRTSLDELPQLWNVLMGDMSLVGPRPLPLRDYAGFDQDWQRRRFSVLPGITCLWQVTGRSNIGFDRWMELDMQYIDGWSFWLDLKILLLTIPCVFKGAGAA